MSDELNPPPIPTVMAGVEIVHRTISEFVASNFKLPNETLWHYSRAIGCHGIISTDSIRLHSIRFMNDSRELLHAIEIIRTAARGYSRFHQEPEAQLILQQLLAFLEVADDGFVPSIFVACLSEKSNDLNQWRAYTGPGQGYSLGFDGRALFHTLTPNGSLLKVIYDQQEQLRLLFDLIGRLIMVFIGMERGGCNSDDEVRRDNAATLIREFFGRAADFILGMKHEAFREEAEWRLVCYNPLLTEVRYLAKEQLISPYVEARVLGSRLPMTEIMVGPGSLRDANIRVLRSLLNQRGYLETKIGRSDIPYRVIG